MATDQFGITDHFGFLKFVIMGMGMGMEMAMGMVGGWRLAGAAVCPPWAKCAAGSPHGP